MSLWTPGGEHEVPRDQPSGDESSPPSGTAAPPPGGIDPESLTPEQREQLEQAAAEMAEVQKQVAAAPASDIIANHVMGFYELAAIHLSQQPPNLDEARVAIDAMTAVTERLQGRLGEAEATLDQALSQLQMAFVQLSESEDGPPGDDAGQ